MDMEYLDSNILHKLVFPFFFVGGNIVAPQICTPRMNQPPQKKNGGGQAQENGSHRPRRRRDVVGDKEYNFFQRGDIDIPSRVINSQRRRGRRVALKRCKEALLCNQLNIRQG